MRFQRLSAWFYPVLTFGRDRFSVTNTDDFLIRLMKGCIALGTVPEIANVVNMVPVDYVSKVIASVVGSEEALDLGVFQIWQRNQWVAKEVEFGMPIC